MQDPHGLSPFALGLSQMGHGSEEGWQDTSGTCGKLAKFMGKTGNENGGGSYGEE